MADPDEIDDPFSSERTERKPRTRCVSTVKTKRTAMEAVPMMTTDGKLYIMIMHNRQNTSITLSIIISIYYQYTFNISIC